MPIGYTPDLSYYNQQYPPDPQVPYPTDEEKNQMLAQILQGQPDVRPDQLQLLDQLVNQRMVEGLSNTLPTGGPGLNFSGPVAGYQGPPRPSDVPYDVGPISTMPPQAAYAQDLLNSLNIGGQNLQDISAIGQAVKPFNKDVQQQLLQQGGVLPKPSEGGGGLGSIGLSEQQAEAAQLSAYLKANKVPTAQINEIVAARYPELATGEFEQKRKTARAINPAPAGTYLNKQGEVYSPVFGEDVEKGSVRYAKGSPQEKTFNASHMIDTHVDQTLEQLKGISQVDQNKFNQYLNTQLRRLQNDPKVNTLIDFLGPATALAVASAYAASGASLRGGARLAEMFKNGVYAEGDTLRSSLNKLKTLEKINLSNAQFQSLHPVVIKRIQDRISTIDKLMKGGSASKTLRAVSKSGKPIISKDGGKTWSYASGK